MAINLGQRSSSLGSGKVEYTPGQLLIHFGSPAVSCATGERDAKRRALEDFYGADVPASTVDRVIVRDLDDDELRHPFVD